MQKGNVENLKVVLNVVRKTTKAIKIFPFVYAGTLLIVIPMVFFNEDIADILNEAFFISPLVISFLLYLSYAVKLCFWHRLQCTLPLIPQAVVFCDYYICELGEALAIVNFVLIIGLFILSLVNAYFVFIRPTRTSVKA